MWEESEENIKILTALRETETKFQQSSDKQVSLEMSDTNECSDLIIPNTTS